MVRNKRKISTFSLSFLDIMSCGFGAAVLLFLIIKHQIDVDMPVPVDVQHQASEVRLLEEEIEDGEKNLAKVRNTISEIDEELAEAQGLAARIMEEKRQAAVLTEELVAKADSVTLEEIKARIRALELEKKELEQEIVKTGEDARRIAGDARQQYLTGLRMDGERMLILLDTSASMLDDTIVNIIRFRNMRDEVKRNAGKWKKTVKIVEWLAARFPTGSKYQIYTFNTETAPLLPETRGQWLAVTDRLKLQSAMERLAAVVPENGTNLEKAFLSVRQLNPSPDNIYLITDGLPTQGPTPSRGNTISGKERLNLFRKAMRVLPSNVPVNVILTPLEGDPDAAPALWTLAQATRGSFMSPAGDWP